MQVRDGMSEVSVTVGPSHTLRQAAAAMVARNVGAALVIDDEAPTPGILTERDLLLSIGAGFYTARNFSINTDINKLISPDLDWRKRDNQFAIGLAIPENSSSTAKYSAATINMIGCKTRFMNC